MTDRDRAILHMEATFTGTTWEKIWTIRRTFGWSEIRYYQRLLVLASNPTAIAEFPTTTARVRSTMEHAILNHWSARTT